MKKTWSLTKKLQSTTPVACILGDYVTSGLGIIRGLGQQNIQLIWLDANPKNIGFLSKYCTGIHCPSPKDHENEYIDVLLDLGRKLTTKAALIPIGDVELLAILKHRQELEKYFYFTMAPLKTTEKLLNKELFAQTLEKYNLPHPKTYLPKGISDIETLAQNVRYPCIVKPVLSARFRLDFHTKLFVAHTPTELITGYEQASVKHHAMMIQEIIPGDASAMHGFNAYYDRTSTPIGSFMYQRIREWPLGFGNGCLIQRVNIPELEELITPLMKKIKYYGIVDVEFKKDPRDGQFKIIEINPRVWMQNNLPTRCGINHPHIAYQDAIGTLVEKPVLDNYQEMKWLFMVEDIKSTLKTLRKKSFSFHEWLQSYKGKKVYAVFARDDPRPFVVFCSDVILSLLKQKK
jgi:D-aspartate ligase